MLKRNLPDLFTLANLLFGCIGIMLVLKGEPVLACYTILISGVFDFFDGMIARALKINNPHGKDLSKVLQVVFKNSDYGAGKPWSGHYDAVMDMVLNKCMTDYT